MALEDESFIRNLHVFNNTNANNVWGKPAHKELKTECVEEFMKCVGTVEYAVM
jgi:hypothetical protein